MTSPKLRLVFYEDENIQSYFHLERAEGLRVIEILKIIKGVKHWTPVSEIAKRMNTDPVVLRWTIRYEKINQELEQVRNRKEDLELIAEENDAKIAAFEASYEKLASLKETWPLLDDDDKRARLSVIVKDITVIKEGKKLKFDITLYMDTLGSDKFVWWAAGTWIHGRHSYESRREM